MSNGILPALLDRPPVRARATGGHVRAVFVVEPDEDALRAAIVARGRALAGWSDAEVRVRARAYLAVRGWLAAEAHRYGLPVVTPRPWDALAARIAAACARPLAID